MTAPAYQRRPGYEVAKRRSKARSRAFHRLAAMHRADFLRLLGEEQGILDAEAAPTVRPVRVREATLLDDPALRYIGVPVSRPQGWEMAS